MGSPHHTLLHGVPHSRERDFAFLELLTGQPSGRRAAGLPFGPQWWIKSKHPCMRHTNREQIIR